jgi:D-alanyl-D-alanine carboxypeptidase/D-alanyl-D-alanine-endopeptidase (penicillin-binding protein 4)
MSERTACMTLAVVALVALTLFVAAGEAGGQAGAAAAESPAASADESTGASGNDGASDAPGSVYEAIDWVVKSGLSRPYMRGADVGIIVESLATGRVLYEHEADAPKTPASNMKVVTSATALAVLGPDYRFETTVLADSRVSGPALEGNLYVRGAGDPSLVSEELWKIAESVRVLGIEQVTGDLVLDASCFDTVCTTSETVANGDRAYHARTGGLSLNFNSIAVYTMPGPERGSPAVVSLAPATSFVELRNEATTGSARSSSTLEVHRTFENGRNVITVSGRIPAVSGRTSGGSGLQVDYRSLDDGLGYFGDVLRGFLTDVGVEIKGDVVAGTVPDGATTLTVHQSKPLSLIVRDLNKFSNNFVAEQLLKVMAAGKYGPPGTTEGGIRILRERLMAAGIDSASFHIEDGSGFSSGNRLTPRTIATVIRDALTDFGISYEFGASLSVSGTDGTLSDRMGYPELKGAVRAKTGLLDGVTAISGIMEDAAGEIVVFSILVNGFECEAWRVHDFEHSVLSVIGRN